VLAQTNLVLKWLNGTALHGKAILELGSVTCHTGSHSATYHVTGERALPRPP